MAEQILRTLGAEKGARGSWAEGRRAAVGALVAAGVDSLDVRMVDGSGLSTQDLLTPRALVRMLRHARRQQWGDRFLMAMPFPGQPRGTLENRLTDLRGRVRAKTGTLSGVHGLAGVAEDVGGGRMAFAVVADRVPMAKTLDARLLIDRIAGRLAACRCGVGSAP